MSEGTAPARRFACLDGVRGIGAVIVVIHHCMLAFAPDFANGTIRYLGPDGAVPIAAPAILWSGNLCVCLFFLLSGYVLTPMTLASRSTGISLIVHRIVRLAPPVLAALIFAYAVWRSGWLYNVEAADLSYSIGWLATFYQTTPHFIDVLHDTAWMPVKTSRNIYDPVVWTMHWEYMGSFGVVILYSLLRRRRALRLAALLAIGIVVAPEYYACFAAGALLADIDFAGLHGRLRRPWQPLLSAALLAIAVSCGLYPWSNGPQTPWHWLDAMGDILSGSAHRIERPHMLAAVCLLGALLLLPRLQIALASRPLLWLGRYSFLLYLVHFPILCSLGSWVFVCVKAGHGLPVSFACAFLATLTASLAVSWLFTRAVDEPSTRLSRRVGRRIDAWLEKTMEQS